MLYSLLLLGIEVDDVGVFLWRRTQDMVEGDGDQEAHPHSVAHEHDFPLHISTSRALLSISQSLRDRRSTTLIID